MSTENQFTCVEEYIQSFEQDIQLELIKLRETIRKNATEAEEGISYGMPAYKLKGKPLVYFAAFKNHIGFYVTPNGHLAFEKELSIYKKGKGSVQFPHNKAIPFELIRRIVKFRTNEKLP